VPERVEVPNKSIQLPIVNKRGEKYGHKVELFITKVFLLIFPLGLKEFCLVYQNYFGFSHRIFPERFLGKICCITSPDFYHMIFKELFNSLQDH